LAGEVKVVRRGRGDEGVGSCLRPRKLPFQRVWQAAWAIWS
jgi:hypothetical protein